MDRWRLMESTRRPKLGARAAGAGDHMSNLWLEMGAGAAGAGDHMSNLWLEMGAGAAGAGDHMSNLWLEMGAGAPCDLSYWLERCAGAVERLQREERQYAGDAGAGDAGKKTLLRSEHFTASGSQHVCSAPTHLRPPVVPGVAHVVRWRPQLLLPHQQRIVDVPSHQARTARHYVPLHHLAAAR